MTTIYGTQVTAYYTAAQAAFAAGGAPLNIAGGSVVVGDGNGVVPLLSQLIANGGCLNPIAGSGAAVASVALDPANSAQIDISIVVPATVNGVETGPFTVREFAIYDALGNLCAVGVTNLEKSTSSQGQIADLAWTASIVTAVAGAVIVTPPSSGFATVAQVQTFFDANLPTAAAPLTQTSTTNPQGWVERVFGIRPASQPADPVTAPEDAAATGYGRPASAAEFSSGTPLAGGFPFPWPTIGQVHAALNAIIASIAAIPILGAATTTALGLGRIATTAEAIAGVTAPSTPAPAWLTPEDLSAALTPLKSAIYVKAWGVVRSGVLVAGAGVSGMSVSGTVYGFTLPAGLVPDADYAVIAMASDGGSAGNWVSLVETASQSPTGFAIEGWDLYLGAPYGFGSDFSFVILH